jgi:hypothetical protein
MSKMLYYQDAKYFSGRRILGHTAGKSLEKSWQHS